MGDRLRNAHLGAGLTHRDPAAAADLGIITLVRATRGATTLAPRTLRNLARVLGVTADWLLTGAVAEQPGDDPARTARRRSRDGSNARTRGSRWAGSPRPEVRG